MTLLELNFLGPFDVTRDSAPVSGFASDKVRALLAYVAVESRAAHRREALAGLLWPEYPDTDAMANLRLAIHRLRQVIEGRAPKSGAKEEAQVPDAQLLLVTPQTVRLDPKGCHLDADEFSALVEACRTHRHRKAAHCTTCHARYRRAADLYKGDFLAGFLLPDSQAFDEWLVLKREGLRRQALEVFDRLFTYHEARNQSEEALGYIFRQLEMEPWREDAHRSAMKLMALDGKRTSAIAQYETCRRVLQEELGIAPEPETVALYDRIRSGDTGSEAANRSGSKVADSLLPAAPMVGREEERAKLVGLLDSPDHRMITLIGLGGVGKTRLAQQAAHDQESAFSDGACFIPLAAVDSPALLASTIAESIKLRVGPGEQPDEQIVRYLQNKEMLLVFDNYEHLLDGGTNLLVDILNAAPSVVIMATSRERLGLQSEYLVDLTGLPFPAAVDEQSPPTDDANSYVGVEGYPAVRLFVERARQVNSEFVLSAENVAGVLDICKLVAGLPLGIVLAAAWARHFSPEKIARSIRENLDFLASTSRDARPQHSSLRAVFNNSWTLLSAEEQMVFRKLSVFRGGWDEEAAEQVTGVRSLYTLISLVDKSLLRRDATGRFSIHEVLRQYAAEQLEAMQSEQTGARAAHVAYFLELAEKAEQHLRGLEAEFWLGQLDREHDNLRAALEWSSPALHVFDVATFQRFSAALWRFWFLRSHYKEGLGHLNAALATLENSNIEPQYAARIYHGVGVMTLQHGDFAAASQLLRKSIELYKHVGDKARLTYVLLSAGICAHNQADYAKAVEFYSESLATGKEIGDSAGTALALNNWGNAAREQGDYEQAQTLFSECFALTQENGDKRGTALALSSMGIVAWAKGDYAAAVPQLQQSLKLNYELSDRLAMSNCLELLGRVAASQARADGSRAQDASRIWGAAQALREAINLPWIPIDIVEHERSASIARQILGAEAFEAARVEGRAMSMERVLAYALSRT